MDGNNIPFGTPRTHATSSTTPPSMKEATLDDIYARMKSDFDQLHAREQQLQLEKSRLAQKKEEAKGMMSRTKDAEARNERLARQLDLCARDLERKEHELRKREKVLQLQSSREGAGTVATTYPVPAFKFTGLHAILAQLDEAHHDPAGGLPSFQSLAKKHVRSKSAPEQDAPGLVFTQKRLNVKSKQPVLNVIHPRLDGPQSERICRWLDEDPSGRNFDYQLANLQYRPLPTGPRAPRKPAATDPKQPALKRSISNASTVADEPSMPPLCRANFLPGHIRRESDEDSVPTPRVTTQLRRTSKSHNLREDLASQEQELSSGPATPASGATILLGNDPLPRPCPAGQVISDHGVTTIFYH